MIYYNIGMKTEVNFLTTFKMLINSFQAGVSVLPSPEQLFVTSTLETAVGAATSSGL